MLGPNSCWPVNAPVYGSRIQGRFFPLKLTRDGAVHGKWMSTFLLKLSDMRFPLRLGETLLGRSPYCSIVLSDPRVSREHAALRVTPAGPTIQDLGSRNGTRVNGELLTCVRQLEPGDRIEIGSQAIELEIAGQPAVRRHPLSVTHDCPGPVSEEETPTAPGTARRVHRTDAAELPPPGK